MPKWYDEYPRLDERKATAPDTPTKHRAKKNKRRWCKGKVGVKHVTAVRLNKHLAWSSTRDDLCYRADWWPKRWALRWSCSHERYCTACGKIMNDTLDSDCPNYEPTKVTRFREVERARIKAKSGTRRG